MNRRFLPRDLFASCTIAGTLIASGAAAMPDEPQPTPPNIILFLVDDLGWQDMSVPLHTERTPLNERYHTPNLERLVAAGMRFTNAYASAPVCTPTRTSIMTGKSPGRSHITYWTLYKDRDTSAGRHPTLDPPAWNMNGLQQDDVTLSRLLQEAGYRTIHVGKAHFGAVGTSGADPKNLGFDVNIAGHAAGGPASYYGEHHFTVAGRQGKEPGSAPSVWDIPGLEAYHGEDIYLTEALTIEAEKAIEAAVKADRPFYMNFAPYAVHAPIMANKRYLDSYDELDDREAAYATMIESVDAALGSLVATLDELAIADQTIIVFHSDNGGLSAHARGEAPDGELKHTHNAPLRSGKGSAYEGGTRVPAIIAWPGVVAGGTSCNTPIISHDLFPTILAMAGVEPPADHAPRVEGCDITPLLEQEETWPGAGRSLFWHQPHQWGAAGPGIQPFTSIRAGDWKLIYFHADRRFELYNLARDIGEAQDLAAEHPKQVAALAARMDAWIEAQGVQLSRDKETGEPVEMPGEAAQRLFESEPAG
jgi:arylsulfatase A-like enzyme